MQHKNSLAEWSLLLLAEQYGLAGKAFYEISILAEPHLHPSFLESWNRWRIVEREWGSRGWTPYALELFGPAVGKRPRSVLYARYTDATRQEFVYFADEYKERHRATWPLDAENDGTETQ